MMRPAPPGWARDAVIALRRNRTRIDVAVTIILGLGAAMIAAQLVRAWAAGRFG